MQVKKEGIIARAQEVDGEFIVLAGSQARASWVGIEDVYMNLREKLVRDETLVPDASRNNMVFSHDQAFTSPSAAAAMIAGRVANGRTDWRLPHSGKNYGQWQNEGVEEAVGD